MCSLSKIRFHFRPSVREGDFEVLARVLGQTVMMQPLRMEDLLNMNVRALELVRG